MESSKHKSSLDITDGVKPPKPTRQQIASDSEGILSVAQNENINVMIYQVVRNSIKPSIRFISASLIFILSRKSPLIAMGKISPRVYHRSKLGRVWFQRSRKRTWDGLYLNHWIKTHG
jgi:hypothetical protein